MRPLKPIKPNNNNGPKTFFATYCTDLSKGKRHCIQEAFENFRGQNIEFYEEIRSCLKAIGFSKVVVNRKGDTNNRIDATIVDKKRTIPIEIKSPGETEYVNMKSIRQALENKVILLSRKFYPTRKETTSLAIGYEYPNDRSEVTELIEYVYDTYDINIGIISLKVLLTLRWEVEFENKTPDLESIFNLRGMLE